MSLDEPIETPDFTNQMTDAPILRNAIGRAQKNRTIIARALASAPFYSGIEELITTLRRHAVLMKEDDELARISYLVGRIEGEIVSAFECLRSGMHSAVSDFMRPVMEAEYLFSDFAADPSRINQWLGMTSKERWNKYNPNALRLRRVGREGGNPKTDNSHFEYHLHSSGLHFGPTSTWYAQRGISESQQDPAVTICLGEIIEHGHRFLMELNALVASRCKLCPTKEDLRRSLSTFYAAWEVILLRIEVWKELEGRDEEKTLADVFPEHGPIDMLRILRYGTAKGIAEEFRKKLGDQPAHEEMPPGGSRSV